jgi:predicted negative regulator of RcsB-dependent stress response
VIAAEGDPAAAIKVLESVDAGMFAASYDELKGDLYAAAGDRDQARAAYRKAIAELNSGAGSDLVQMKLDDLGAEG